MVECEQSAVKLETAPTAVKAETEEADESAASSVPYGASAAGNEEPSGEQHDGPQQSENREAGAIASAMKEEDNAEELNVEEIVQPTNDITGDDGKGSPVLTATTSEIPTSEAVGGKKRSREATYSTRNASLPTRSKKRSKLPHSRVHETSEEAGITAHPRAMRRSLRRAPTKARELTFEGIRAGSEVEEGDGDLMTVVEEELPLDYGDADDDEDGRQGIVAKIGQQDCSAFKSFDGRFRYGFNGIQTEVWSL